LLVSLLCVAVPSVAVTILATSSILRLLAEHSQARLANATQQYAHRLAERLALAEQWLDVSAGELAPGVVPSAVTRGRLAERFTAVSLVDSAGQQWPVVGDPLHWPDIDPSGREWLAEGHDYLYAYGEEGRRKRVLLLRVLEPRASLVLAAELAPTFLWGDAEGFAPAVNYCVTSASGATLSCSRDRQVAGLAAVKPNGSGPRVGGFPWHVDGTAYPARYATVGLARTFGSGDWVVVARERDAVQSPTATEFALAAVAITLLCLAVAGMTLKRILERRLSALTLLGEDIAALEAGDSGTRVRVPPDDELAGLALLVKAMIARMQAQATTLRTLEDLDRGALAHTDLLVTIRSLLDRIPAITGADTASVTLFEPARGVQSHTHLKDYHDDQPPTLRVDAVARDRVAGALAGRPWCWTANGELVEMGLDALLPPFPGHFLLLPVAVDDTLLALLTVGYRERETVTGQDVLLPQQLTARFAVAVMTARQTQTLIHHAHLDPLTQLFNRTMLEARLEQALAEAKRSGQHLALLMIGLPQLKEVNHTLGYAAGDEVLREAARRLLGCVKKTDTLARIGGSQFAAVLTDLVNNHQAMQLAGQVQSALGKPFRVAGHERHLVAPVGVSIYPKDSTAVAPLLHYANAALSRAEGSGDHCAVLYDEQMSREASARLALEPELRAAIERGEFLLHYQPRVALATRRVTVAQAALRWKHPVGGLVAPDQFLPVAELAGLMAPINAMMLRLACEQLCAWDATTLGIERVALRISGQQLARTDFFTLVETALRDSGLSPERFELEVGADTLAGHVGPNVGMLTKLASLGLRLALDDFGGGRYALSDLPQMPFHSVKLGAGLVSGIATQSAATAIAGGLIGIAHSLGKEVVADAVSTPHQVSELRNLDCDLVQGSYFSPAVAPTDFDAFVAGFASHAWAWAA